MSDVTPAKNVGRTAPAGQAPPSGDATRGGDASRGSNEALVDEHGHSGGELRQASGSRLLRGVLVALPFLVAIPVCLSHEVTPGQAVRFAIWTCGWWLVGIGLTGLGRAFGSHRMASAAYGGVLAIAAQLVAWAIAVSIGHAGVVLPVLLGLALLGVLANRSTREHLLRFMKSDGLSARHPRGTASSGSKRNAVAGATAITDEARERSHPSSLRVPTFALAAWSFSSTWLLGTAAAFFRDNSFSSHRSAAYQDLYWHLGIVGQLKHHLIPPVSESDTGANLNYHWLSDAFMASGSLGAHVSTVMAAQRLWLIPVLLLAPALMVVVAREVSRTWSSAIPAVAIITVATTLPLLSWQSLGPSETFALLSPSQVFGVPMTLFALALITRYWRSGSLSAISAIGLVATFFLCAGSKSSILPVFLGGITLTLVLSLLTWRRTSTATANPATRDTAAPETRKGDTSTREASPRATHTRTTDMRTPAQPVASLQPTAMRVTGVKIWCCALLAQVMALPFFAGGSAGSKIRLVGHLRHWKVLEELTHRPHGPGHGAFIPQGLGLQAAIFVAVLVILVIASYGVGLTSLALSRETWRTDPMPLLLVGSFLTSIAALCLIDHTGQSESYFPMGAMPLLAILSAWGFGVLWDKQNERATLRDTHRSPWFAVAAGVAVAAVITAVERNLPQHLPGRAQLAMWFGIPLVVWMALAALGYVVVKRGGGVASATALLGVALIWPAWQSLSSFTSSDASSQHFTVVNADEQAGLAWIRNHTPANALVATNVHCLSVKRVPHCTSSAYWTNGFAERRFFVGSWGYTDAAQKNAGLDGQRAVQQNYPDHAAYELNEAMFYAPSADVAKRLRARGVTWLYTDSRVAPLSPKLGQFAHKVGSWGQVSVYRL